MNNLNVVPMPASSVWLVWDEVEITGHNLYIHI